MADDLPISIAERRLDNVPNYPDRHEPVGFMLRLVKALHTYGVPSYELEQLMANVADQLEYGTGVSLSVLGTDLMRSVLASSTSLLVSWQDPVSDHGATVTEYILEFWRSPGREEIQIIETDCSSDSLKVFRTF